MRTQEAWGDAWGDAWGALTVALVGPHGAGKTTIGRALAARLGCRFDEEIGRRLRDEALRADPLGGHALAAQPGFDRRVAAAELARDAAAPLPRVVETWHPGNLAYARRRSPRVAAAVERALRRAPQRGLCLVQPLRITPETARRRLNEPGPDPAALVRFFLAVGTAAEAEARALGLAVLPPLATDDASVAALVGATLAAVERVVGAPRRAATGSGARLPPPERFVRSAGAPGAPWPTRTEPENAA